MSVSSTTARTAVTIAGLPQTVPVFEFNLATDLLVVDGGTTNSTNNPATVLTLNSDYTVAGGGYNASNQLQTGSIIIVAGGAGNVQTGDVITITRNVPETQTTSFSSTGALTPIMIEQDDDKNTTIEQQNSDAITRSMRAPVQEAVDWTMPNASTRISSFPYFDVNGNLTIYSLASLISAIQSGSAGGTVHANYVYAGPTTGAAASPTFRALVAADLTGLTGFALAGDAASSLITTVQHTILGRSSAGPGALQELTLTPNLVFGSGTLDTVQSIQVSSTPQFKGVTASRTDNSYQYILTGSSNSFGMALSGSTLLWNDISTGNTVWSIDAADNFYFGLLTTNGTIRTGGGNGAISVDAFGQLTGTATNDNAGAGKVGQFLTTTVSSPVSLTSNTATDIVTQSLTAGDWDVQANFYFAYGTTTTSSAIVGWLNTTSATDPGGTERVTYFNIPVSAAAGNALSIFTPTARISLAGTATVYASCSCVFATSTMTGQGTIRARRVR